MASPTIWDYLQGAGETAATLGTGAFAGFAGPAYGIYKGVTSPDYGTVKGGREADRAAIEMMEKLTYQPRGQVAQGLLQSLGGVMNDLKIPAVTPQAAPLAALGLNKTAIASQVERAGMAAEKAIEPAVLRTLQGGGTNAQMLQDMVSGSRSKMFIGPESKLWDKNAAFEAQKLLKRGVTPQEVWKATGTAKAPDGQFRQEISDIGSALKTQDQMLGEANTLQEQIAQRKVQLADSKMYPDLFPKELKAAQSGLRQENKAAKGLIDALRTDPEWRGNPASASVIHDKLFEAYPELKDQLVKQGMERGNGILGYRNDSEIGITKQGLQKDPRSTLLHEMQHGVQEIEDFGRGGSTSMVRQLKQNADFKITDINVELKKANYDAGDFSKPKEFRDEAAQRYNELLDERQKLVNIAQIDPAEGYSSLAGEAEARLTQVRRNLTDAERRQSFPFEFQDKYENPYGLDVPPDLLWNINGKGIVDFLK